MGSNWMGLPFYYTRGGPSEPGIAEGGFKALEPPKNEVERKERIRMTLGRLDTDILGQIKKLPRGHSPFPENV